MNNAILNYNCVQNGCIRIFFASISMIIVTLFNWSKTATIFTSLMFIRGNKNQNTCCHRNIKQCVTVSIRYGFVYIIFMSPVIILVAMWALVTMEQDKITYYTTDNDYSSDGSDGDYFCIILFPEYLFLLYLLHELIVNIFFSILFIQPLINALKRQKYVIQPKFGQSLTKNSSQSFDDSQHTLSTALSVSIANNNNIITTPNVSHDMYDRLNKAILRNSIAGLGLLVISTLFFGIFIWATFRKNTELNSITYDIWGYGYLMSFNVIKYILCHLFMGLSYPDWPHIIFPLCCLCKNST